MIQSFVCGDVSGDKIKDNVFLTGTHNDKSAFTENIILHIQDGKTGINTTIPLNENGYNPTIYLRDFTGNGIWDILISITTGSSGGLIDYFIYSFFNNIPIMIFNYKVYNKQYQYEVTYKNNYLVEVISYENKMVYFIDLSYKGREYLDKIYDKNGQLKYSITGFVDPISGLYPIDYNTNHVYSLLVYQQISGQYHADSLGYIQNELKWNGQKFDLTRQSIAIFGTKIDELIDKK